MWKESFKTQRGRIPTDPIGHRFIARGNQKPETCLGLKVCMAENDTTQEKGIQIIYLEMFGSETNLWITPVSFLDNKYLHQ